MTPPRPNAIVGKLREIRRGVGEILSFAGAGVLAVIELLTGRWPGARKRPPDAPPPAHHRLAEKIAPYPTED